VADQITPPVRHPPAEPLVEAERTTIAAELRHWRAAAVALGDLDLMASPAAWAGLETYLGSSVRASLHATTRRVGLLADQVAAEMAAARDRADLTRVRQSLLRLRRRYLQAETVVEFFAEAVNSRINPRVSAIMRGLDALAVDSMERVLRPLRIDVPPVLTYLDKGLGASILRSGTRLWDASLSPAAAIKVTHHNLWQPTSMVHETGHQVAHLTGWTSELAEALHGTLYPVSPLAAEMWRSWASEVAADVYAFALLGYAPLPALATVVDGTTAAVFRMPLGDPHPFGWLRVQFNAALCRSWFGAGPWDRLARVWAARHPIDRGPAGAAEVARASVPQLPALAEVCTRSPMRAFGRVPLSVLADPRRVAPAELTRLARQAGASLYTSSYLQRLEPMRILAWTVLREQEPDGTSATADVDEWLRRIGGEHAPAA
jgi:hypothetical protein